MTRSKADSPDGASDAARHADCPDTNEEAVKALTEDQAMLDRLRLAFEASCAENHKLRQTSEILARRYQDAIDELISAGKSRSCLRLTKILARLRRRLSPAEFQDLRDMRRSIYFDADWYLHRYPDVQNDGINPALHYLRHGAGEFRDPGPLFSTAHYVRNNPDVETAGVNPLLHFERHGRFEGRAAVAQVMPDPRTSRLSKQGSPRVLFVTEHFAPLGSHRVRQLMKATEACGGTATRMPAGDLRRNREDLASYDVAIFHRVAWSDEVAAAIAWLKARDGRVIFDTDELDSDPDLLPTELINAATARSLSTDHPWLRRTMQAADACMTTTEELAFHLRLADKITYVLSSGFDRELQECSRLERRRRQIERPDGLIRMGCVATSDAQFAAAAPAVARILRANPQCRLVLLKDQSEAALDPGRHDAFAELHQQIEWRNLVPDQELAREFARLDISLAPSQVGRALCESNTVERFWRAALVDVPTVSSPTGPFSRAIREGQTGFFAATDDDWYSQLKRLVDDPRLRRQVGRAAYHSALAHFGPETRALFWGCILEEFKGGAAAARGFALRSKLTTSETILPEVPLSRTVFEHDSSGASDVTVVVPLYNYQQYIEEALNSVFQQRAGPLDLVVVDGHSSDNSLAIAETWAKRHAQRFNRILVIQNQANYGLGHCRNCGVDASETPYVVFLDADNKLLPDACTEFAQRLRQTGAAFAYAPLQCFGASAALMGNTSYSPQRLVPGNYIDALAAVSKEAWAIVGGINHVPFGWEDYDLWCRFAEFGLRGEWIEQPLALYRVHASSMQATQTKVAGNLQRLMTDFHARHAWTFLSDLEISRRHQLRSSD